MTWKRRTPAANRRRRRRAESMLQIDRRFVQWCEHFARYGGEFWDTDRRRTMLETVTRARRLGASYFEQQAAEVRRVYSVRRQEIGEKTAAVRATAWRPSFVASC